MRFSLGNTASTVAAARSTVKNFIKNNLKIYFDFASKRAKTLEFVGTGSTSFDGTNDQLSGTLTLSGDRSFAFWIKSSATTSNMRIFHCETDSSEFINFSMNAGEINCYDGTNNPETDDEFNDGVWHHVALTQATNSCKIYVDGVLEKTGTTWVNREASSDSFVMGEATGANDFNGSLKNFAIWNRVLSISEVQNIMYKTYSDLKGTELTHLVSWYAMEESKDGDTSKMIDSKNPTTAGYDLSITNATVAAYGAADVYGEDTPRKPRGFDNAPTAQADLIGSGSASFNGSSDYVEIGDHNDFSVADNAHSMAAWVKMDDATNFPIIFKDDQGSNREYGFGTLAADDKLRVFLYDQDASAYIGRKYDTALTSKENTWQHCAYTYDGSTASSGIKLYIDGVRVDDTDYETGTYVSMENLDNNVHIGRQGSSYADGNIAQVGIWNAALTQEQIQSIKEKSYSELTTSEKTNLVSWWGLDSALTATMRTSAGSDAQDMVVADLNNGETLGSELFNSSAYTDNDLYFNPYGSNTMTYTSNSVTITRGGGSGNASGALWYFNANTNPAAGYLGVTTETLTAGAVYKLTFDFESDDSNAVLLSLGTGTGNIYATDGNGTKTMYIMGPSSGTPTMRSGNLSDGNYIKVSNISIKKVTQHHGFLL